MKKVIINKKDLENNIKIIKTMKNKKTKIIGVVKANGMGLDLVKYSKFLTYKGIDILAVADPEDAFYLRKKNVTCQIILLTPVNDEKILERLINNNIVMTIGSLENLEKIKKILVENVNKTAKVHIKIDTGFGRYGFLYKNYEEIIEVFKQDEMSITVEGIYTHFSKAIDKNQTKLQFSRFMDVINKLENDGIKIPLKHCANSTAFIKYPEMHLDAVRLGSIIQGRTLIRVGGLKKIGTFETTIPEIKKMPKGSKIGYSNIYKLKRDSIIATIPVGHADGFETKNKRDNFTFKESIKSILIEIKNMLKKPYAEVIIQGKKYPVIGRIGLNYALIDITNNSQITTKDKVILDTSPLNINSRIRREYI